MPPQWTLTVEGLGRIQRAEVRTHPLMLFVGENNSGKSYLASLLWGLMTLGPKLFPAPDPSWESYRSCREWLDRKQEVLRKSGAAATDERDSQVFFSLLKEVLERNKDNIVRHIFNQPDARIAELVLKQGAATIDSDWRRSRWRCLHPW